MVIRTDIGRLDQLLRDNDATGGLPTPNTTPDVSLHRSIAAEGSGLDDSIRDDQPPNTPSDVILDASMADEGAGMDHFRGWILLLRDDGVGMNVQVWVEASWENGKVQRHKISREKLSNGEGSLMYLVRYGIDNKDIWSHRADIRLKPNEVRKFANRPTPKNNTDLSYS
ncbi:unnamed protein product [Orchesella dallaii]|uniref:Uncharacterized protein n=1 Tax=Orchesella dallaii TaxID=48710 RepID=A0ABP1S8U7_9HEXA